MKAKTSIAQIREELTTSKTQPNAAQRRTPSGLSEILAYVAHMAQSGSTKTKSQYSVITITERKKALISLARKVNILDAQAVKNHLLSSTLSKSRKNKLIQDLIQFYKHAKIQFEMPPFREGQKLPNLPLECDVRFLIDKLGKKTRCFTRAIYETGARPIEMWNQEWKDTALKSRRINISHPAKCSNGRNPRISPSLAGMLRQLKKNGRFVFHTDYSDYNQDPAHGLKEFSKNFFEQRKRAAEQSGNDRILQINWKSLRHLKGTNEYIKSCDILHVKDVLGHRSLQNTLLYIHLAGADREEHFDCKTARTEKERHALIELGYELVSRDSCDVWYFRRRAEQ